MNKITWKEEYYVLDTEKRSGIIIGKVSYQEVEPKINPKFILVD